MYVRLVLCKYVGTRNILQNYASEYQIFVL